MKGILEWTGVIIALVSLQLFGWTQVGGVIAMAGGVIVGIGSYLNYTEKKNGKRKKV